MVVVGHQRREPDGANAGIQTPRGSFADGARQRGAESLGPVGKTGQRSRREPAVAGRLGAGDEGDSREPSLGEHIDSASPQIVDGADDV